MRSICFLHLEARDSSLCDEFTISCGLRTGFCPFASLSSPTVLVFVGWLSSIIVLLLCGFERLRSLAPFCLFSFPFPCDIDRSRSL